MSCKARISHEKAFGANKSTLLLKDHTLNPRSNPLQELLRHHLLASLYDTECNGIEGVAITFL